MSSTKIHTEISHGDMGAQLHVSTCMLTKRTLWPYQCTTHAFRYEKSHLNSSHNPPALGGREAATGLATGISPAKYFQTRAKYLKLRAKFRPQSQQRKQDPTLRSWCVCGLLCKWSKTPHTRGWSNCAEEGYPGSELQCGSERARATVLWGISKRSSAANGRKA